MTEKQDAIIKIDTGRLNQISEEIVKHMNIIHALNKEREDMWDKLEDDYYNNSTQILKEHPIFHECRRFETVMVANSGSLMIKFNGNADVSAATLTEIEELTGLRLDYMSRKADEIKCIFKLE
jgi:hypothetical protein